MHILEFNFSHLDVSQILVHSKPPYLNVSPFLARLNF